MPLEGDWQLPRLARSVTLPILRWPNRLYDYRGRRLVTDRRKDLGP